MNNQKLTRKSIEAVTRSQMLAAEDSNMQVEIEHLLLALLIQENELIPNLFEKMGINPLSVTNILKSSIDKLPKVTGSGREMNKVYVSPAVEKIIINSEKIAKDFKDEYISVEHLMISIFDNLSPNIKNIFSSFNFKKSEFLEALKSVRHNPRITSDNPEDNYDALNKYGYNLVERARNQKLDPVIV